MKITNNFEILLSSDLNYKLLTAEIYFHGELLAILNQDEGLDNIKIEIYPPDQLKKWTLNLHAFEQAINAAKKRLIDRSSGKDSERLTINTK